MPKEPLSPVKKLLAPFGKEITERMLELRAFVWDLYPSANELIYDNYNALAIGWSLTDRMSHTFCSIAAMRSNGNIHFGFYYGNLLTDSKKILKGEGKQYRYLLVNDAKEFPKAYVKSLVKEAYKNSYVKIKDPSQICSGLTLIKSVAANKRKMTPRKTNPVKKNISGKSK